MKHVKWQCEHSDLSVQFSNMSCSFYFPISLVKNRNCSASHWRTVCLFENEGLSAFQLHDMTCETTMFICLNMTLHFIQILKCHLPAEHSFFHHTLHPQSRLVTVLLLFAFTLPGTFTNWKLLFFFPFHWTWGINSAKSQTTYDTDVHHFYFPSIYPCIYLSEYYCPSHML